MIVDTLMSNKTSISLFAIIFITNLLGILLIDLMDIDAAQYASIGREMLETGSYLQVQHRGADYLDKPPLLFWLTALFFNLFGVSDFVYRLPAMLFTLLGVYSVYRLGCLIYNSRSAVLASLIFYSSQAIFTITHDVRTDTILISTIVFSVWQIYFHLISNKLSNLILGSVGIGLSMLEKGPIGLMVPFLIFGTYAVFTKQYKIYFRARWITSLVIVLILLLPMLIGLYQQFGKEGLLFYFWTQSFGRITGQSEWKDSTDGFFFIHTFLWTFAPWMIIAISATYTGVKNLIKTKFSPLFYNDIIPLAGFILPFIALSFSKYKLPHYIFITFPFASLLAGSYLDSLFALRSTQKRIISFYYIQLFISILFLLIIPFILIFVFPTNNLLILMPTIILLGAFIYFAFICKTQEHRIFTSSVIAFTALNLFLNTAFYPQLLKYQAGSVISKYVNSSKVNLNNIYFFQTKSQAFDFYTKNITKEVTEINLADTLNARKEIFVFTKEGGEKYIEEKRIRVLETKKFNCFHVTMLTINFLNRDTRHKNLTPYYLIKIAK